MSPSNMVREVNLGESSEGRLYLYRMLGRSSYGQTFESDQQMLLGSGVCRVISLASFDEIKRTSPEYARRLRAGDLPWIHSTFAIEDFGVPALCERDAFVSFVQSIVCDLRRKRNVLVHCGAGIGRTGMVAACVLLMLGLSYEEVMSRVRAAGSGPETKEQEEFVTWFASVLNWGSVPGEPGGVNHWENDRHASI